MAYQAEKIPQSNIGVKLYFQRDYPHKSSVIMSLARYGIEPEIKILGREENLFKLPPGYLEAGNRKDWGTCPASFSGGNLRRRAGHDGRKLGQGAEG
jgi:hypothetical protein